MLHTYSSTYIHTALACLTEEEGDHGFSLAWVHLPWAGSEVVLPSCSISSHLERIIALKLPEGGVHSNEAACAYILLGWGFAPVTGQDPSSVFGWSPVEMCFHLPLPFLLHPSPCFLFYQSQSLQSLSVLLKS